MALTQIKTGGLANNSVTNAKMADNAIDSVDIAAGSIDNAHLAGSIAVSKTLLAGGTGLTLSTNTLNVDAAQTQITSVGTLTGLTIQGSNYTTASIQAGTTSHGAILNLGDSGDIDYGSITQFASSAGEGGRMRFIAGTTETMNLRGGKVGIGENVPLATLHVKEGDSGLSSLNSSGTNIFLEANGANAAGMTIASGNTANGFIIFGDSDSNFRGAIQYDHSSPDKMHFTTAGSQRMTIDSDGKVGIGTTSPGYQLDLRRNDTGTTTSLGIRQLGTGDASMAFQTTTSPYGFCIGVDGSDSDAFKFATGTDDVGTNTKMTITSAGNVGIGTASPLAIAHIKGTDNVASGTYGEQLIIEDTAAYNAAQYAGISFKAQYDSNSVAHIAQIVGDRPDTGSGTYNGNLYFLTRTSGEDLSKALTLDYNQNAIFEGNYLQVGSQNSAGDKTIILNGGVWDEPEINFYPYSNFRFKLFSYSNGTTNKKFKLENNANETMFESGGNNSKDFWFGGNVSADSFTDRTPYPETLKIAYDVLASHKKLDDYDVDDKQHQLDHTKLHDFAKPQITVSTGMPDDEKITKELSQDGRDASAVISCLVEVVNDLTAKVEALENA
jgi:hypothetical protein